jgi:hypothetical protein
MMRFPPPNLDAPIEVSSAALGLINVFSADLFDFIHNGMSEELGQNWLNLLQQQDLGADLNYKDPAALLKELVQKGQSPLRRPISALVPKANWKDFYNRLDDILQERNKWVHNSVKADSDALRSLVLLVNKVSFYLELPVTKECNQLLEHISPPEIASDPEVDSAKAKAAELDQTVPAGEVGAPLMGPFIAHTYTLHLDGSIRDRSSDQLLHELVPASKALGQVLISRKPNGGRLKINSQGQIAAYFGDYWGLLGEVEPKNWFPGHIK